MREDPWEGKEPGDYSGLVSEAGPCRLGGKHSAPGFNGMVYCEHGFSVFACPRGCTETPPLEPNCGACGKPKDNHTEAEAAYCITREIASLTDTPVYITGP